MHEYLQWPDTRAAVQGLLDGTTHAGYRIRAAYYQSADEYGRPLDDGVPEVVVYEGSGGAIGYVDRVDELTLDVFAPAGEAAKKVAESVVASRCGVNISTPEGLIDTIRATSAPVDVPYQSATHSRASATIQAVTRPI